MITDMYADGSVKLEDYGQSTESDIERASTIKKISHGDKQNKYGMSRIIYSFQYLLSHLVMCFFAFFTITNTAYAEDGSDCLQQLAPSYSNSTKIKNKCSAPVTFFYCSTVGILGKACGQNDDSNNPYFTHGRNIGPDKIEDFSVKPESLRNAVCKGKINVGSPRFFSSDTSGKYQCPPLESIDGQIAVVEAAAGGSDQNQACSAAKEMISEENRLYMNCRCKSYNSPQGNSKYICRVIARASVPNATIMGQLKSYIRSKIDEEEDVALKNCLAKGNSNNCTYLSSQSVATGVRN